MKEVTNEQKLEAVKSWLTENGIEFKENHVTRVGLQISLWVPSLFIAVHVSDENDENDEKFYVKTCKWCKPFFIRESETKAFVLEKIQNCAYDQMLLLQKKWQQKNAK